MYYNEITMVIHSTEQILKAIGLPLPNDWKMSKQLGILKNAKL